jgi:serine/threonine protein kinase
MSEPNRGPFSIKIKGRSWAQAEKSLVSGRYALEKEIGRGGVGEVLLAHDTQLERWVAVKRIHMDMGESAKRAQFAIDEAKRLARLQHPNIVTVYDILEHKGDVLMVMEYLSGYTLEELKDPLSLEDFVQVARQSLNGLGAAHSIGLVHLDIKSTNIMLTWLTTGHLQVKLLDFGLATIIETPMPQTLNPSGSLLGSVYTMAPEQFEQNPVGIYTDFYALGCVYYHALTREEPFQGKGSEDVMNAHLSHTFVSLIQKRPDLPPALCSWVETLMAREPESRPLNADTALKALISALPDSRANRETASAKNSAGESSGTFGKISSSMEVNHTAIPSKGESAMLSVCEPANPSDRKKLEALMGKAIAVEGVVAKVWENVHGTFRFLNFEGLDHLDFSIVLDLSGEHQQFSMDRLQALVANKVRVQGKLSEYHGCPQIIVKSPTQMDCNRPG